MLDGQFSSPARIVASNTAEGWSRDIASELRQHFAERGEIPSSLKEFLEEHHGQSLSKGRQRLGRNETMDVRISDFPFH